MLAPFETTGPSELTANSDTVGLQAHQEVIGHPFLSQVYHDTAGLIPGNLALDKIDVIVPM